MRLEQSIYPYNPETGDLPFCLTGIGGSEYQGHIYRPEGYKWHQILFCAEGKGVLKYDDVTVELNAGNCVFLPENYPHEYYPVNKRWDVRWIAFEINGCDRILNRFGITKPTVISAADNAEMENIFDKMLTLQRTDILYCDYTCSGLVYDFIIAFHRHLKADADSAKSRRLTMLLPALQYMYDNFRKDFSLAFLADLIGVTPQHFCRLFRETLNMRPNDYLIGRRLDEAKRLICENKLSIAEIAELSGFHDPSYFSTVFKKREGISPAEYRKRISEL